MTEKFHDLAWAMTAFGESYVILAASLAMAGWLWVSRQQQLSRLWLISIVCTASSVLLLKLSLFTCGHLLAVRAIQSPSGHTAMASMFYGGLALTARGTWPAIRRHWLATALAAAMVILAIGLTRLILALHTPAEVLTGFTIGIFWLAVFSTGLVKVPTITPPRPVLLGLFILGFLTLVGVTMGGRRLPVEGVIRQVALFLQEECHICRT